MRVQKGSENPEEGVDCANRPARSDAAVEESGAGEAREAFTGISCSPVSRITEKAEDLEESKGSLGVSPEKPGALHSDLCVEKPVRVAPRVQENAEK